MPLMYKDDKVCMAQRDQIKLMEEAGWSIKKPEVKPVPKPAPKVEVKK